MYIYYSIFKKYWKNNEYSTIEYLTDLLLKTSKFITYPIELYKLMKLQNVVGVYEIENLKIKEGILCPTPLGFVIYISRIDNPNMKRFSLAHELIHTFFYDYDSQKKLVGKKGQVLNEERLCNYGAASILMPRHLVINFFRTLPINFTSIFRFAQSFEVSIEAAFLRLVNTDIWKVPFIFWCPLSENDEYFKIQKLISANQFVKVIKKDVVIKSGEFLEAYTTNKVTKGFLKINDLKLYLESRPLLIKGKKYMVSIVKGVKNG